MTAAQMLVCVLPSCVMYADHDQLCVCVCVCVQVSGGGVDEVSLCMFVCLLDIIVHFYILRSRCIVR